MWYNEMPFLGASKFSGIDLVCLEKFSILGKILVQKISYLYIVAVFFVEAAAVEASYILVCIVGLGQAYVPATREDYDNGKELWDGDWAKYRTAHLQ